MAHMILLLSSLRKIPTEQVYSGTTIAVREFVCEVTVSTRDGHRGVLRQMDSGGLCLKGFHTG